MKERIVIADDNINILEHFSETLRRQNYLPIKSQRAQDLREYLKTNSPPELIIFDHAMAINGGEKIINDLHKNYKDTFIIHLLDEKDNHLINSLIKDETDEYLIKPINDATLLMKVAYVLKYRQARRRNKLICHELLEANQKLSAKTKECQELINFNQNVLESLNVGLFTIDYSLYITSWNNKIGEIIGIDRKSAEGKHLFSIFPYLNETALTAMIDSVMKQGEKMDLGHIKGTDFNGKGFWGEFKISPIKKEEKITGAVITVDDITQKLSLQREFDKMQLYLSNLVEHSADAIISYSLEGTIVTWNNGAKNMFGYTKEESVGRSWDFTMLDESRKQMNNLFEWVKKTGSVSNFKTQMMNKSGQTTPVMLTLSLIKDSEGNVFGISGIYKDLSEAKKLKEQIIQSQKMISLGLMSAGMAHDINNPLGAISAYIQLLQTKTERIGHTELTDYLAKVEKDADHIGSLVKNLLWYAKSRKHMDWVDIHELLERALEFANYQSISTRRITIRKEFRCNNTKIIGQGRELAQTFINIIINAIDAMPNGGTIIIQTTLINRDDSMTDYDWICIKFIDNGIGIPPENLDKIFEQFFTTRSDVDGNGLGLYVAQAIIENHGGKIEVESHLNEGSCFSVYLPIKEESDISTPFIE
ncbi:MAG: PAS domain S-box protein [bacterium]